MVSCALKDQSHQCNPLNIDILKWGSDRPKLKGSCSFNDENINRYLSKSIHVETSSPLSQKLFLVLFLKAVAFVFLFPDKPCELFCSPLGKDSPVLVTDRVLDGTPCGPYETDLCVHGKCQVE